jgi:signal transduction histidine kinase
MRLEGQQVGLYDAPFGTALRTVGEILLFSTLIWWTARSISQAEEQAAAARRSNAESEAYRLVADAQEAERKRLSMELHDHVGQQITALRMTLQPYCQGPHDAAKLQSEITKSCDTLKNLDNEVSLLAWQLRPSVLDEFGLNSALQSFGREWAERHGIELECDVSRQTADLPPAVETGIFRIVQEALNNIAKHSDASRVDLTLGLRDGHVMLVVEDNGRGFENHDPSGLAAGGLGLAGMRERTALMGGSFEIESEPGSGTSIFVRVPAAAPEVHAGQGKKSGGTMPPLTLSG